MPTEYEDKLKDPRWLHKRHSILLRDNFMCLVCQFPLNLEVHHIKYNGDPWESDDDDLLTLCAFHHREAHGLNKTPEIKSIKEMVEMILNNSRKKINNN